MSIYAVNGSNFGQYTVQSKKNAHFKAKTETSTPIFGAKYGTKTDASNDGKFTTKEALKNFGKGLISPIKAVIDHPLIAIGTIAATGLACVAIPALTPILTLGFGALSLYEVGKGTYDAAKNYKNGEYDAAEKSFEKIGTGTIGTVLTTLGLKSSAKVSAEVKQANQLGRALTNAEKLEISNKVKSGSYLDALKENLSIITTKEGRSALVANLNPKNIIGKFKKTAQTIKPQKFQDTIEGQRRAKMSTKDLEREVTETINKAFDEMGIPKEARPKIVISDELRYQTVEDANALISKMIDDKLWTRKFMTYKKGSYKQEFFKSGEKLSEMTNEEIIARIKTVLSNSEDTKSIGLDEFFVKTLLNEQNASKGGHYTGSEHQIVFNTGAWRNGKLSTEEIAVHETLHAKMAILRNSLSKDEVTQIVKQELLNRIKYGEPEEIISGAGFLGNEMMKPPKMSSKMRTDYLKFAEKNLYSDTDIYSAIASREFELCNGDTTKLAQIEKQLQPIITELKNMIKNNPEFVAENGGNETEALNTLLQYTKSQNFRYCAFSKNQIKNVKPITLTPQQHQEAVESLIGQIETIEGNSRIGGVITQILGATKEQFNQYQFSYEELLARNTAAEFEKSKIQTLLQNSSLTSENKAELTSRLKDLDFVLEYNKVGKEYYSLYTKALNNPNDTVLAEELKTITAQLQKLEELKNANPNLEIVLNNTFGFAPYNITPYLPKKEAA